MSVNMCIYVGKMWVCVFYVHNIPNRIVANQKIVHYEKKSIFVKVKLQHNLWHGERNVKTTAMYTSSCYFRFKCKSKKENLPTFDSDKSLALTCVIIQ